MNTRQQDQRENNRLELELRKARFERENADKRHAETLRQLRQAQAQKNHAYNELEGAIITEQEAEEALMKHKREATKREAIREEETT